MLSPLFFLFFSFLHESRRGRRSVFSYQTVSCFLQNIPYEIDSWCLAVGIEPIKPVSCLFLTSDQPYKEFSCKFSHLIFRAEHLGVCSEILPAPLFFPCLFFFRMVRPPTLLPTATARRLRRLFIPASSSQASCLPPSF